MRKQHLKPPHAGVSAEVDAKITASEAIRAVRVIIGRPKPPEINGSDTPMLPESLPSRPAEGAAPD